MADTEPPTRDAPVTLHEVTKKTLLDVIKLSETLTDLQKRAVESNAQSIAEAYFSPHAWFRAIYAGETLAGFLMMYDGPWDPPEDNHRVFFLWRLMIAAQYQNLGFGRKAIEAWAEEVRKQGGDELLVSCIEGEGSPEEFYRRLGFERTGQMSGDEPVLSLKLAPTETSHKMAQLQHFFEPDCYRFEARVVEQLTLPGGRTGVILDHTYFYPTGGGQEHDLGTLGSRMILDVYKDEDRGVTVHVVDGGLLDEKVIGEIDADRRRRHRQHHTAQHLLSGCFVELLELETLSANINGDTPSSVDLDGPEPDKDALLKVERRANQIIWEDRAVKTYFVSPERLSEVPLRKPPKVSEDIRIVEIDGMDYSACGGTHVSRTGGIGLVKIVRTEKVKEKTRIHFVAGARALELFEQTFDIAAGLAGELTVGFPELPETVRRLAEQARSTQRELSRLQAELLAAEAARLAEAAEILNGQRVILAAFSDRSMNDLRALVKDLSTQGVSVSVLASESGGRASLVVGCAAGSGVKAGDFLRSLLPGIGGKGGGDATLAQGGGTATREQLTVLLDAARDELSG